MGPIEWTIVIDTLAFICLKSLSQFVVAQLFCCSYESAHIEHTYGDTFRETLTISKEKESDRELHIVRVCLNFSFSVSKGFICVFMSSKKTLFLIQGLYVRVSHLFCLPIAREWKLLFFLSYRSSYTKIVFLFVCLTISTSYIDLYLIYLILYPSIHPLSIIIIRESFVVTIQSKFTHYWTVLLLRCTPKLKWNNPNAMHNHRLFKNKRERERGKKLSKQNTNCGK